MNLMEAIDHTISGPARKLSDFAHTRKKGSDIKLANELCVIGNVAIIISALALGHFFFAFIAAGFFIMYLMAGGWRPETYAFRPAENDLNRFLKLIVMIFGIITIINAGLSENLIVAIMGVGFLTQLLGDQMLAHRIRNA